MAERRSIVFINQATGYLTVDIINAFVRSGHFSSVALIAGSIRLQDVPLDSQVNWSKITLYDRGNPRKKLLSWLNGTVRILFLLLTKYRKFEVFYITIPPFAYLLSLVLPNRFSVLVFDVYPDVLKIYNIRPGNMLYKAWASWNRSLFRKAHRIYTIGDGMSNLLQKYAPKGMVTIIHNWSGLRQLREIPRHENVFLREQGLEGKFVVQYSGNVGYTHNIEVLIEIARNMQPYPEIFFMIIGRGERMKRAISLVHNYGLQNCRVLPFQPDAALNYTLSAADLGVVLLDERTADVSIPSKIYNLQAVGVPILGIVNTDSELARHVNKHQNGACFEASDSNQIAGFILKVKEDVRLRDKLKANSRKAASEYTFLNALDYAASYLGIEKEEVQPDIARAPKARVSG